MKNPIEMQIKGIKCDAQACDYVDQDVTVEQYEQWLNKPCPQCGANLLTQEDFDQVHLLISLTNMMNQVFPQREEGEEDVVVSAEMNGTGEVNFKPKK